jgi:hypothetical protein
MKFLDFMGMTSYSQIHCNTFIALEQPFKNILSIKISIFLKLSSPEAATAKYKLQEDAVSKRNKGSLYLSKTVFSILHHF